MVVANANGIEGIKVGDVMERTPDGRWFPTLHSLRFYPLGDGDYIVATGRIYVDCADVESRVREDFTSQGVTVLAIYPGGNVLKQGYSEVVVIKDEAARQLAENRRYPTEGVMKW